RGEQHVTGGIHQAIAALYVAQLVDEGEQQRQPDDDAQYRQDRQQYMDADVAIELMHGPPPHSRDACVAGAARAPRTASASRSRGTAHVRPTAPRPRECGPCPWHRERQSAARDRSYKEGSQAAA